MNYYHLLSPPFEAAIRILITPKNGPLNPLRLLQNRRRPLRFGTEANQHRLLGMIRSKRSWRAGGAGEGVALQLD